MVSQVKSQSNAAQSLHHASAQIEVETPKTATDAKIKKVSKSCFKKFFDAFREKLHAFLKEIGTCIKILVCFSDNKKKNDPSLTIASTSSEESDEPDSGPAAIPHKDSIDDKLKKRLEKIQLLRQGAKISPSNSLQPLPKPAVDAKKLKEEKLKKLKEREIERQNKLKAKTREEAIQFLTQFAKTQSLKTHCTTVTGLKNIGNSCYMNAAIQNLRMNLYNDQAFQTLIAQPLIKEDTESLSEFEARLLKDWAPLTKEPKESQQFYEDRILFKYSFLAIAQALEFGASKDVLAKALNTHRNVFFRLRLHTEFYHNENGQKDSASYHHMWYERLQCAPLLKSDRNKPSDVSDVTATFKKKKKHETPLNMIMLPVSDIQIPNDEMLKIETKMSVFKAKKNAEIAALEKKTKAKIEAIHKKAKKNITESAKKDQDEEIEKIEKDEKKRIASIQASIQDEEEKHLSEATPKVVLDGFKIFEDAFEDEAMPDLKYKTATGKVTSKSIRTHRLEKISDSFIVQFERFASSNGFSEKIMNPIDLSNMMTLDLKPYMAKPTTSPNTVYELNSFVVHEGSFGGGHYISYIKKGKTWYSISDDEVKVAKNPPFKEAYLCSYVRS